MKFREKWIKELGEEKGLEKWYAFKKALSERQSGSKKEKWIKKFGKEEGLKKWNTFSAKLSAQRVGSKNNMAGKSIYDVWLEKYGKEEADKRMERFKKKMSEVTSGEKNPMYGTKSPFPRGISTYEFWLKRYGKEEADRRKEEYSKKLSVKYSGKGNPMYGKSPANTVGAGISGRYKGWAFRSLLELSYMVNTIEKQNLTWEKGEQKKFTVEYIDLKGTERTTKPDFYLVDENKIIEIKPKYILNFDKTKHKLKEAREAYNNLGYNYEVVTPETMSLVEIKKLYEKGCIVFSQNKVEKIENAMSKVKIKE